MLHLFSSFYSQLDLKEENKGKIIDFSDKDFFIPPLVDHSNTSFINLESLLL